MSLFIFCIEDNSSTEWRYRASAASLNDLLNKCYGSNGSLSKSKYKGKLVHQASLLSCQTGDPTPGEIYELTKTSDDTINPDDNVGSLGAKNISNKLSERTKKYLSNKNLSIIVVLTFLLVSCGYSKNLTGRYKEATVVPIPNINDNISVKGYALNIAPAKATAPFRPVNLATEAQVKLIKELGKDVDDPDKLIKLLGTPIISSTSDEPAIINKYTFSRRLVLSVRNKSPFPENRIFKLEITLTEPNNYVVFTGCDKLATEYQTVDQGKLTFKNNITGEMSATGELGPSASTERNFNEVSGNDKGGYDTTVVKATANAASKVGVGGKLGFARELSEEASLKQRYVSLSGSVNDNSVSLYEESISGIDLSGNIVADVEFEVPQNLHVTKSSFNLK